MQNWGPKLLLKSVPLKISCTWVTSNFTFSVAQAKILKSPPWSLSFCHISHSNSQLILLTLFKTHPDSDHHSFLSSPGSQSPQTNFISLLDYGKSSHTHLLLPTLSPSYLFWTWQPNDIVKTEVRGYHSSILIPSGFPFPPKARGYDDPQGPTQYSPMPITLWPPLPFPSASHTALLTSPLHMPGVLFPGRLMATRILLLVLLSYLTRAFIQVSSSQRSLSWQPFKNCSLSECCSCLFYLIGQCLILKYFTPLIYFSLFILILTPIWSFLKIDFGFFVNCFTPST